MSHAQPARVPRPLLVALALGLLMHMVVLRLLSDGWVSDAPVANEHAPSVQVRSVSLPEAAPAPATEAIAEVTPPSPSPEVPPPEPAPQRSPDPAPEPIAPPEPAPAPPEVVASAATPASAPEPAMPLVAEAAQAAASQASSADGGAPLPVYLIQLPPPVNLRFGTSGSIVSGTAELSWKSSGRRYEAQLAFQVAGLTPLAWKSDGAIDITGLAPERFTDRRPRGEQAANFRRDQGRITFSGPATEYPLYPGTQDRLSWLVQVPAIVAADPGRFTAGSGIRLFVVGARGDADVWVFRVQGTQPLTLYDGRTVEALWLVREPRHPHDTRSEVWLDPTRYHLPVRAQIDRYTLDISGGLPTPP